MQASWYSPRSCKSSGRSGPSISYWSIISAILSDFSSVSGDSTVAMVGLKEMADLKEVYSSLTLSYSVFRISSQTPEACTHATPVKTFQAGHHSYTEQKKAYRAKLENFFVKSTQVVRFQVVGLLEGKRQHTRAKVILFLE